MEKLVTAKGNVLVIELLNNQIGKNIRGNMDAERIYKVNDKVYKLGVHKSYNGNYYALSMEIQQYKNDNNMLCYSFDWDVEKVYHFNGKIRATEKKENWLYENL